MHPSRLETSAKLYGQGRALCPCSPDQWKYGGLENVRYAKNYKSISCQLLTSITPLPE